MKTGKLTGYFEVYAVPVVVNVSGLIVALVVTVAGLEQVISELPKGLSFSLTISGELKSLKDARSHLEQQEKRVDLTALPRVTLQYPWEWKYPQI